MNTRFPEPPPPVTVDFPPARWVGWFRSGMGCCLAAASLLLTGFPAAADDKSGVSPNTISVPKGPGSIEGLGESFQPSLNSGTARYAMNVKVPEGPAGMHPEITLQYESGNGNGAMGIGWMLAGNSIQRRTDQGMPTYGLIPHFPRADTFINDGKEELVPLPGGYYFCKNEGPFIRYQAVSNHWEANLADGTRLQFGLTDQGRVQDTTGTAPRIFSWLLEREMDTRGNVILFSYTNFPGAHNLNQKYLSGIAYGPGASPWNNFHFVQFVYEDRGDWVEDCRAGFPVRTGKRLKTIRVGTQGPTLDGHQHGDFNGDGIPDNLNSRYELRYTTDASTNSPRSFLSSVQEFGADDVTPLPILSFGYNLPNPAPVLSAAGVTIFGTNEPRYVMDNSLVDLIDANGDGLPDILKTSDTGGPQTVYLNQGVTTNGNRRVTSWSGPQQMTGTGLAQNYNLSANSVHLADMDGDGMADLVVRTALDQVFYFRNQATNGWGNRQAMAMADIPPPAPFGETNVRTADLDFDKRTDILQSDGTEYHLWLNLGNGQYFNRITVPQTNRFDFALPQVQVVDFNGDRVPDVAWIRPTQVIVTAGLGYAQFAPPINVPVPDFPPGSTRYLTADLMSRAKLQDIDGDGLVDLVIERVPGNELWYWINQGNYTFSGPRVITGMPSVISAAAVTRWADINGNGTTDLIYADSLSTTRLVAIDLGELVGGGMPPNALVAITNGVGAITLIGYRSSTTYALADAAAGQPWPDPLPFPVNVVSAVTNLDSLGGQYAAQFAYHNAFYDPVQHQFRGFGRAEQIDLGDPTAPTLVTRNHFDTGKTYEVMKGKRLAQSTEQIDGSVFWSETNYWALPPAILYVGTNGTNVLYAHPTKTVRLVSELGQGTPQRLESEFAFDNYGNQTLHADYGIVLNGNRTAGQDERITETTYAINTNTWILHHPSRQEVHGLTNGILSRAEFYYDDPTFSGNNFGQVSQGNLTLQRTWTNAADPNGFVAANRVHYDAFGNAVQLFDPLASVSGGQFDAMRGHAREVTYDSQFQTYPVTETIHVGQGKPDLVFQATFDPGQGATLSTINFNGNLTRYTYDAFGRILTMVKPYSTTNYPNVEYAYALGVPVGSNGMVNYVESRQLDVDPAVPGNHLSHYRISRQFLDGLGRTLMGKVEAEPAPGSTTPRVVINGAVLFNARARVAATLNPCFSQLASTNLDDLLAFESITAPGWQGGFDNTNGTAVLPLASAPRLSTTYDSLLRTLCNTNADATFSRLAYEPLLIRIADENQTDPGSPYYGISRVHYQDGLGRLSVVAEVTRLNDDGTPGGSLHQWQTRYRYDLNDHLVQTIDAQNNVQSMTFDGLGRKTMIQDPDRGTTTYFYDDASNLTRLVDAKNQVITYTYDGVNRILTEDLHDEGLPFSGNRRYDLAQPLSRTNRPDVAYFYDQPTANVDQGDNTTTTARNTRGRLAYIWDLTGEEHLSFDDRDRLEYTVKRLPDPVFYPTMQGPTAPANPALVSYKSAFSYDVADRPATVTYPDNDAITYQYNARGLHSRIVGGPSGSIISAVSYNAAGQTATMDYGNGVRTTYDHDNRLRLAHLQTFRNFASTNDPQILNLGYVLDGVSNLRQVTDQRPGTAIPAGDPRRNTQVFQYDDLYRLTQAQYSFALPGQPLRNDGLINYRYDRIGNPLGQSSSLTQTDPRTGLPSINLGTMASGGPIGTSGRPGRKPGDAPGPHALTSVVNPQAGIPARNFAYDDNGNMQNLDGLACTWDFKDRLVVTENDQMRAEYSYDYLGRRTRKTVTSKPGNPDFAHHDPVTTTLYPANHFEVRDHDAPTKYVFKGGTRVAHATGSLSGRDLRQRIRLFAGWNLRALSVTATNCLAQLAIAAGPGDLLAAYQWVPQSASFAVVAPGDTLPAGTVLWLNVASNTMVSVSGAYAPPTDIALPTGGTFLAATGFDPWLVAAGLPAAGTAWHQAPASADWQLDFGGVLQSASDLAPVVAPGEAVFIHSETAGQIPAPQASLRLRFYHEDHLGSPACLTDADGNTVDEKTYLPFGGIRSEMVLPGATEVYGFIDREMDRESGLQACGARFLATGLGRFLSVDPVMAAGNPNPQRGNSYVYALNRPLSFVDPMGTDPYVDPNKATCAPDYAGPWGSIISPPCIYTTGLVGTSKFAKGDHIATIDPKTGRDGPRIDSGTGKAGLANKAKNLVTPSVTVAGFVARSIKVKWQTDPNNLLFGASFAVNGPGAEGAIEVKPLDAAIEVGITARVASVEPTVTVLGVTVKVEAGILAEKHVTIGGRNTATKGKFSVTPLGWAGYIVTYDATKLVEGEVGGAIRERYNIPKDQTIAQAALYGTGRFLLNAPAAAGTAIINGFSSGVAAVHSGVMNALTGGAIPGH